MTTTGRWIASVAALVVLSVLALQYTKQEMLPKTQTPVLWAAAVASVAAVAFLASGVARDAGWREEQARLGTLVNNFYEPRREALINGFAIGTGVLGALWWATATWAVMFTGMRRHVAGRGLADFQTAALVGACAGGLVGAALGLVIGYVWETRHRRKRIARAEAAAHA